MTKVAERIRDKVVFLSGATGGLGRAMAERLAEEGAHLVLTDLDASACQALASDLGGTPGLEVLEQRRPHVGPRLHHAVQLGLIELVRVGGVDRRELQPLRVADRDALGPEREDRVGPLLGHPAVAQS